MGPPRAREGLVGWGDLRGGGAPMGPACSMRSSLHPLLHCSMAAGSAWNESNSYLSHAQTLRPGNCCTALLNRINELCCDVT